MTAIDATDLAALDAALAALPDSPAVFALFPRQGRPYLARTALLRRRLLRLLKEREKPSRLLNLRGSVERIEYALAGSSLETSVVLYQQARRLFPETYLEEIRLRMPCYVKIGYSNAFPRASITTRPGRGEGAFCGPFRSRAAAERFTGQMLDLFQLRRCLEDLQPSPTHPGCIYGEMQMCLRPCQQVVGESEYRTEAKRVAEFLETGGRTLLDSIERTRDRMSEEMNFEEAARLHKRYEKVQETLKLRDELARELTRLEGAAITRSAAPDSVELWVVRAGAPQPPLRFSFEVQEGKPVSLDRKLREALAVQAPRAMAMQERQEHLALLARWYYSSWRDGEWVAFEDPAAPPFRKLVNAISRVARGGGEEPKDEAS